MQGSDHSGVEGSSVAGSSSGTAKQLLGVKDRRFVEIEPWVADASFITDVTGMSSQQAAMVHDLAWAYANPDHFGVEQVNIQTLVEQLVLDMALFGPTPSIDELKKFVIGFVRKHPLKEGGTNPKEWVDSVKESIAALAPLAFQELKEWVSVNAIQF